MQAREFLSKLGDLNQTQIFAKIENVEVSFFEKNKKTKFITYKEGLQNLVKEKQI